MVRDEREGERCFERGDEGMSEKCIRRRWWNKKYKEEKSKVRKELRKWKGMGDGSRSRELRVKYKKMIEDMKEEREENLRWEKKVRKIKTEGQV